ncbi:MAG: DUF2934 domain-containing protein [Alphaproteobacteria bacterium]|nr:DUF2934 domain-containing protein [Alphaproteobacteria bacterium]
MNKHYNEENIRVAAYYIWEQAGRPEGAEKECWIKACEQLFAANHKKTSCKKASNKTISVKASAKVAKPVSKKTTAKSSLKVKSSDLNLNTSASSLNMPFYGAKKK